MFVIQALQNTDAPCLVAFLSVEAEGYDPRNITLDAGSDSRCSHPDSLTLYPMLLPVRPPPDPPEPPDLPVLPERGERLYVTGEASARVENETALTITSVGGSLITPVIP